MGCCQGEKRGRQGGGKIYDWQDIAAVRKLIIRSGREAKSQSGLQQFTGEHRSSEFSEIMGRKNG